MVDKRNGSTTDGAIQKRARQQLSCMPCRAGKLKCDRNHPCDQCIKRARDSSCSYPPPPKKKPRRPMSTKERIAQLEGLVVSLMNSDSNQPAASPSEQADAVEAAQEPTPESRAPSSEDSAEPPSHPRDRVSIDLGEMNLTDGATRYIGSAHWEAILAGIGELKTALAAERDESAPLPPSPNEPKASNGEDSMIILGRPKVTREYLLKSCPPTGIADKMLFQWFNCCSPMSPAVHKSTFLAEYQRFRDNPSETPTMWLALYFDLLSLGYCASVFQGAAEDDFTVIREHAAHYRNLACEALTLADVSRPQRYLAEAMIMYVASEHMRGSEVSQYRLWLIVGVLLRLCLRMGFHRDPSHYPSLSPFDCEMRRRLWYLVHIFDVLLSFSVGLPDMIRHIQSDTRPPLNLTDADFGPQTKTLPPSRPFTELSPITFAIVKVDLVKVFARAADISHSIEHPDHGEVKALDDELEKIYGDIPDSLKFAGMDQCIIDSPSIIFNRFKLQLLYQKTRCVLHRRYLVDKCCDPAEESFRIKCVEAARHILAHLETVYIASQEDGQLSSIPYFLDTFSVHDFLLAAMVLCLELNRLRKSPSSHDQHTQQSIASMKRLLETTYEVYTKPAKHAQVPEKAVKALKIMLNKARASGTTPPENTSSTQQPPYHLPNGTSSSSQPYPPPPCDQPGGTAPYGFMWARPEMREPIGDMLNSNENINWQLWDNVVVSPPPDLNADQWGGAAMDWTALGGAGGSGFMGEASLQNAWYYGG